MYRYQGDYHVGRGRGDYLYARGRGGIPLIGALLAKVAPKAISAVGKLLNIGKKAASNLPVPYVAPAAGAAGTSMAKSVLTGAAAGAAGTAIAEAVLNGNGGARKKRRSMNPLNPKALTRATRRISSFHDRSAKALRQLGYTVQRQGAASRARRGGCGGGCKGKCTC